jgi:hypothetical protein
VTNGSIIGPDGARYSTVGNLLSTFGVEFPETASAGLTVDGKLVVRNTRENFAIADVIVAALIDAQERQLTPEELAVFRTILSDVQAHGEFCRLTETGFEG